MRKSVGVLSLMMLFNANIVFAEAIVVDDSNNYTMIERAETALEGSLPEDVYNLNEDIESALVSDNLQDELQEENAILLYKLQGLQQEVQELRGQLEVQTHDLNKLKQQQLAFYQDLDKKLESKLQLKENKAEKNIQTKQDQKEEQPVQNLPLVEARTPVTPKLKRNNPADEQISYLAAYEFIKTKQYEKALYAMQDFVNNYPQSGYAPNAEYWCGEIYMLKKNYPQAIKKFETVVQKYPHASKTAPSLLKIGYALTALNKTSEAKTRLNQVVRNYPDTPAAELAQIKLQSLNY